MDVKELTYQDVAEHNTKSDLYMVIHSKVYDVTKFIDEHPYVAPMPTQLTQSMHAMHKYSPGLDTDGCALQWWRGGSAGRRWAGCHRGV